MAHAVIRIDQQSVMVSDPSRLDSYRKQTTPKLKQEEESKENCPSCRICYNKHPHVVCPYFTCIPKGAALNPHYEIVCVCGNQFDRERWVCTSCAGNIAMILPKYCDICVGIKEHASYECPVDKALAAKFKQERDETNQQAATIEKEYYFPESSFYVPSVNVATSYDGIGFIAEDDIKI